MLVISTLPSARRCLPGGSVLAGGPGASWTSWRRPRGRASGGRGRCRTAACTYSSIPTTGTAYSPVAAGSPGPLERKQLFGCGPCGLVSLRWWGAAPSPCAGIVSCGDVALRAVIDRDDMGQSPFPRGGSRGGFAHSPRRFPARRPVHRLHRPAGNLLREVHPFQPRPLPRLRAAAHRRRTRAPARGRSTPLGAPFSRIFRVSARVSTPDQPIRPFALHPGVEPLDRAKVARGPDVFLDHAAQGMRVVCLQILVIGADIADVREGEGDDLRARSWDRSSPPGIRSWRC